MSHATLAVERGDELGRERLGHDALGTRHFESRDISTTEWSTRCEVLSPKRCRNLDEFLSGPSDSRAQRVPGFIELGHSTMTNLMESHVPW